MTHYDHATAIAFKLGYWSEDPILRNYEIEALVGKQRLENHVARKPNLLKRCHASLRALYESKGRNAS